MSCVINLIYQSRGRPVCLVTVSGFVSRPQPQQVSCFRHPPELGLVPAHVTTCMCNISWSLFGWTDQSNCQHHKFPGKNEVRHFIVWNVERQVLLTALEGNSSPMFQTHRCSLLLPLKSGTRKYIWAGIKTSSPGTPQSWTAISFSHLRGTRTGSN